MHTPSFTDVPSGSYLRLPRPPVSAEVVDGVIHLKIPFDAYTGNHGLIREESIPTVIHTLCVRAMGEETLRLTFAPNGGEDIQTSEMLSPATMPTLQPLTTQIKEDSIELIDPKGRIRARFNTAPIQTTPWSDILPAGEKRLEAVWLPDGVTEVPFSSYDRFAHGVTDSLPLAYLEEKGEVKHTLFSFHADSNESFAGTGERFAKMDLSGRTLLLENDDGLGVNSRRTYKNIPFYLSSRPYGVFVHSSAKMHFSLADLSTRSAQGLVEAPSLDLFLIGGGSVSSVLYNYCSLTGFSPNLPLWSYGIWMSRMTYFSKNEVEEIGNKLRKQDFPCDVLHIDTGWFQNSWVCDWKFGSERFSEPETWLSSMREQGFRITLWQTPDISDDSEVAPCAIENKYLPQVTETLDAGSDFSRQNVLGPIDFSNPEATEWYQEKLLQPLLKMGVAAIKTDFGENIPMNAEYHSLSPQQLRNRYALLYQKAAFEITQKVHGEGESLIWARSAWAGSQRYPLHWGGDAEGSWDGMAASIRGGLHLGLSGFTSWSHDVPGFHGTPDFMNSRPSDHLYVRWTQFGVFSSHIRYHGCCPREPWEHPEVADIVRGWWKLRYALIPYIREQVESAAAAGLPMLRSMILADERDPVCWNLDDQYLFGEAFLVAPVMNDEGVRDVYLPAGEWIDFWTGQSFSGRQWLYDISSPLCRLPVFVRREAKIPFYLEPVNCTDDMDLQKVKRISMNEDFKGLTVCQDLWGL